MCRSLLADAQLLRQAEYAHVVNIPVPICGFLRLFALTRWSQVRMRAA
jgi:hypothetical protein